MAIVQPAYIALPYATQTHLRLTANAVVKASRGVVATVNVLVAGSAPSQIHDSATVGGASGANQVASIPNVVGTYVMNFPCFNGITFVHGTAQEVSISFS